MIHPFIYTRVKLCEVYTNVFEILPPETVMKQRVDFFGFIPNKESNTWGITILPTFLFSSGSNLKVIKGIVFINFIKFVKIAFKYF